jgi:hypothetical protein
MNLESNSIPGPDENELLLVQSSLNDSPLATYLLLSVLV